MAQTDIAATTTTDLSGTVSDFSVNSRVPDGTGAISPTWWDYPKSSEYLGYYTCIPEIKSALKALSIYVCGQGWTADSRTQAILQNLTGWGEDSFQSICQNLIVQKKIFGDAFAEIIRNDSGSLINLKPLYPGDMRVNVNGQGIVTGYEQLTNVKGAKPKTFTPDKILHLVNDRIANEIHGISVIEALKFVIDAKNEALSDERKIRHRELAMGILELDSDDPTEMAKATTKYQDAVNKGEVLVLPKGVAEIKDAPNAPRDRIQWLQYLDNLFYQIVGVPKVIATSEGYSEAAAKVGIFTFDPVYTSEQRELETDLWNQAAIKVTFNPAPSLGGTLQESEKANTGQTGFQPNDTQVNTTRSE